MRLAPPTVMPLHIHEASLEEIFRVSNAIPEFRPAYALEEIQTRVSGRAWLGLIACRNGKPSGFKLGYETDDCAFYSWLGGVIPAERKSGIARALLHRQEQWVIARGYQAINVKTYSRFGAMVSLLRAEGYETFATNAGSTGSESPLHFTKSLPR